ncbi:hypothetical protein ACIQCM_14835 [Pseudarthrobacter sp. NPDC092439]|uniref:hypothetical protein n=1 Tax=unclassified Pseudarthrobacter TaxID=2647000 RepID=UPI0037F4D07E
MTRPDPESADQGANQDDAVWLDLVARLEGDQPNTGTVSPAPGTAEAPPPRPAFRDFDPLGLAGGPVTDPAAPGPRDYAVDDDDEGRFIPEEPPSLAGTEPLTMLAWLAAVGGPVALLFAAMFWRSAPLPAILGIVAAFVLGTVYLIMQLPQEKDEDDDGARV